jgi:hypothetical protein
MGIP